MQNEKKYIRYKGITRLPSDHDSFDGELEDVVNLSITGGELRPVLPPALIGTIPGQFLFVHKNQGYEHFIYLDGNVVKAYKYEGGSLSAITCNINIGVSTLKSINAIGNTLAILTSQDILYALWKPSAGSYVNLGSDIPFPVINFSTSPVSISDNDESFNIDSGDLGERSWLNTIKASNGTYVEASAKAVDVIADAVDDYTDMLREWLDWRLGTEGEEVMASAFEGQIREAQATITNKIKGAINLFIRKATDNNAHVFPFFVRYALRLYDGSLVKHSPPILILPTKFIPFYAGPSNLAPVTEGDTTVNRKISITFSDPHKLRHQYASSSVSQFSDIVQSVDIFLSQPIYSYVQDGVINGWISPNGLGTAPYIFGGLYKSRDFIRKEIERTSIFYKIHSIPISDFASSKSVSDIPMDNLGTLANQEVMEDDYKSHDKIIAETSFTYNHKLHLAGVKSRPFGGFKYGSGDHYYDIVDYGLVKANALHAFGPQPFMFNPNAKSTWSITYSGATQVRKPMTEHKFLNGSFYLDQNLEIPVLGSSTASITPNSSYVDQLNMLFVSTHQNPFVFPASSRITLPVGRIMAVASNTEAISQGQFGQFPLYVFTDDGIWALEVSNDGSYIARQPVSRDVVVNHNIMQMDKSLAFVTGKGVTLLSGINTEIISDIIRENNVRSSKISITGVVSALENAELLTVDMGTALMGAYESVSFETFAAGASLAYDYITGGGRILVINPLYDYLYVFDIATATWSKVIGSYKRVVNNYPDCYVQDGEDKIYNLANIPDATSTKTTCMIITRPISYEDYNFVIRSLAHRGIFKSALNVVIYASRNGVDYSPIMHRRERLIRMTGSGFKYYKLLVIAELDPNEAISGIEIDFMLKYPGRMR